MRTATAWADRPAVPVNGTLEGLGRLVDAELDRVDGMLFTATPREELEEIGRAQRLKDEAFALQLRAIVRTVNNATAQQREFAADEVALACNVSPSAGAALTHLARSAAALPGLIEAVEQGAWTERHLRSVLDELDHYPLLLEQRQAVVLIALARYCSQTPGELRDVIRRIVLRVDPRASRLRKEQADTRRDVAIYPTADGQGALHASGPLDKLAEIGAALDQALADEDRPEGDDRTAQQRRFDALHRLVTGGSDAGGWLAIVLSPASSLQPEPADNDVELGEIPGLGPILPDTAADLARAATCFERHDTDTRGQLIAITDRFRDLDRLLTMPPITDPSTDRYVATPHLKRFLESRDRTCTFPSCHQPAAKTDKDHLVPWPAGATDNRNMHCLCRHHHRAKQTSFTIIRRDTGDTDWTTRGGWTFTRRPQGS